MVDKIRKNVIAGAVIILLIITVSAGLWEKIELTMYDSWFKLKGQRPSPSDIVIVAVDDRSIKELGAMPWPRQVHARLIDALSDSSVIGFDILFDTPGTPEDNAHLAAAMENHGNVVLAAQFSFEQDAGNIYQVPVFPLEELAMSASGIGFINTPEDIDNVVRRVSTVDVNFFQRPFPCFSLAVFLAHNNLTPNDLELADKSTLTAGDKHVPLDYQNQTLIDFWGPAGAINTYSYIDILKGEIDKELLTDKIVLVGPTAAAQGDIKYTPFSQGNMVLSGSLPSPGVEIHASAIGTYLTEGYFNRAPMPINLLFLLGIGLLAGFTANRANNPWRGLLYTIILMTMVAVLVFVSWRYWHYWLNLAAPLASAALIYTGTTTENLVLTELERRRTRAVFSRYVSPDVVEEILQNKKDAALGGARKNLTILFSDIRGFTSFSENKEPEYIVGKLNEYFTEMTEVIFKHGGTLDKYLGDGIMAFFGAPIEIEDHADKAIITAIEMLERVSALNKKWQAQNEPLIDIGIGINTGPVVVGNIGSSERMDYTIIGEDVNLAARLESANKEYKTRIILSYRTVNFLKDNELINKLKPLGETNIRGMALPVSIYTVNNQ